MKRASALTASAKRPHLGKSTFDTVEDLVSLTLIQAHVTVAQENMPSLVARCALVQRYDVVACNQCAARYSYGGAPVLEPLPGMGMRLCDDCYPLTRHLFDSDSDFLRFSIQFMASLPLTPFECELPECTTLESKPRIASIHASAVSDFDLALTSILKSYPEVSLRSLYEDFKLILAHEIGKRTPLFQ